MSKTKNPLDFPSLTLTRIYRDNVGRTRGDIYWDEQEKIMFIYLDYQAEKYDWGAEFCWGSVSLDSELGKLLVDRYNANQTIHDIEVALTNKKFGGWWRADLKSVISSKKKTYNLADYATIELFGIF